MSKRTLVLLLIIGGIIGIIAVLLWLFYPTTHLTSPRSPTAATPLQPAGLKGQSPSTKNGSKTVTPPAPATITAAERERQAEEALKQQAMTFSARQGTYSNADEFVSIRNLYVDVTASVQTYLDAERQKLMAAHPTRGSSWGQTSRALSARISSTLTVLGKDGAEVTVQVQQTTVASGASSTAYQEVVIGFQKVGDRWVVSHIASRPLVL